MRAFTWPLLIIIILFGILATGWSGDQPTLVTIHGRQLMVKGASSAIKMSLQPIEANIP